MQLQMKKDLTPKQIPEEENYEEEIEEEEEHGDEGDYVEVELEVIPEGDHEGHDAAEGPATEDHEVAGHDDGGPAAHGRESNEEEERHEDDPDYSAEEEFVHEEHS